VTAPAIPRRRRNRPEDPARVRAREGARARLIVAVQEIAGPGMTPEAAQVLLDQARAWTSRGAQALDRYLTQHPTALTAPPSDCPMALSRLLNLVAAAGYSVAVLACAICGRSDRPLECCTSEGRCCNWCKHKSKRQCCARCGQEAVVVTRRPEGAICRRCYSTDPDLFEECADCGRLRRPWKRRADGAPLCESCAPKRARQCVRCGNHRRTAAVTENGPICRNCYQTPARPCGICGQIRPVRVRARGDRRPDMCGQCYKQTGTCVVCGRGGPGSGVGRGGPFHCVACRPRRQGRCDDCGAVGSVRADWPRGTVCDTCYYHRLRHPVACTRCGVVRVLVGRTEAGQDICGPCSGSHVDFACRRCGTPGRLHAEGCCARCVVSDRVQNLLSDGDGIPVAQLRPLAEALTAAENPYSVLNWLYYNPAARLLADLATHHTAITHGLLDGLPPTRSTRYVRDVLVATGALPRRVEHLCRLEVWTDNALNGLAPRQQRILRPFAEWQVIRDARRRAAHGRYTEGAAAADRADIRTAVVFLGWLDSISATLDTLTQEQLDCWMSDNPTLRSDIVAFLRWAVARRLTAKLDIPTQKNRLPACFQTEDEHRRQLRRCLNDDTLPLEVRIVGALVRLYGLPVSRIVELTADRFHHDQDASFLTIGKNPVLLPPKLAALIEKQIAEPRYYSMVRTQADHLPRFLLPGSPPGKPRSTRGVHKLMQRHGLPTLAARNTAMIEAVAELPPIVVSDLFGIHAGTAHAWAKLAQTSWTEYLTACQATK
jgi:hypothetical protein